ncbi:MULTISPECIES: hypothetical protein [Streptomyces]|uniref:Uncharacterized protein n=2 Tax=Streptomyces TaxID=1883 RepID=A0A2U9P438_STRAS|nr:hypothetical protein [Streptomyces actuosus]AWT44539.1 hypothetical protein DMT42_21055 [Streptomyces actuosus]MBM4820263.1 hypothetical protein [Streptomyces actuosus]
MTTLAGYENRPLADGGPLLGRPGFWPNHLWAPCCQAAGAGPERFGADGADVDALYETLTDPGRWPVFRVPCADGREVTVVYHNLVDDPGVAYLLTAPGDSGPRPLRALTWRELDRAAHGPLPATGADGITDPAARLLLLFPLLDDHAVPDEAAATVESALVAVGAPQDTAPATARHLLDHAAGEVWHDPQWDSPLSGAEPEAARSPWSDLGPPR